MTQSADCSSNSCTPPRKSAKKAKMELLHIDTVINLGLPHIAEQIFKSLNEDDLIHCLKVSKTWMVLAEKVLTEKVLLGIWKGQLFDECTKGRIKVVKILLDYGDDTELNATDWVGRTPFARACEKSHEAVAALLVSHPSFEVNNVNGNGKTALMWASEKGLDQPVKRLLAKLSISDINKKDRYRITALMYAIKHKNESVAHQLLNLEGIEVDSVCQLGRTCLMWASINNLEQIVVKLLPKLSPDSIKKCDNDGLNAFMFACNNNSNKVLETMFAKSPIVNWDFNATISKLRNATGFILACDYKKEKAVDLILANYQRLKIDLKIRDRLGKTGMDYWPEKFEGMTIEDV